MLPGRRYRYQRRLYRRGVDDRYRASDRSGGYAARQLCRAGQSIGTAGTRTGTQHLWRTKQARQIH